PGPIPGRIVAHAATNPHPRPGAAAGSADPARPRPGRPGADRGAAAAAPARYAARPAHPAFADLMAARDQPLKVPSNTVSLSGLRPLGVSRARRLSGRVDGSPRRPIAIAASTL